MQAEIIGFGAAVVVIAGTSFGQCAFTTSLVDTFSASPPRAGQAQNPRSGWTFERTGTSGTERTLLTGYESPSWRGPAWASPNEQYAIPAAGPRFSPDPNRNQNEFYRRLPTFEGLMLHPGFGLMHGRAVLTPQAPTTLTSLEVRTEHLGTASANAVVGVKLQRASGTEQVLVPATSVASLAAALTLTPAPGVLPIALGAGDRVVVESADGGNPSEDWLNVNMTAGLSGPPLIAMQPVVTANCDTGARAVIVANGASSLRWRRAGVDVLDGPTGTGSVITGAGTAELRIANFGPADAGMYDCVAANTCGAAATVGARIDRCFADFNCDGFLDFFDYDDFVGAFEVGDTRSDFNGDGFLDFFDYDDFVRTFEVGC